MGHAGASRKSPNDAPLETLSLRLSRPISAQPLTVGRSWRHEEEWSVGQQQSLHSTCKHAILLKELSHGQW